MLRIVVLLSIISLIPVYAATASASTVPCTTGRIIIDDTTHTVTSNSACAGAVTIPTGVTSIGLDAFMWETSGVSSLTSVTFESPSVVTSIASGAFFQSGLTSIKIPASVTNIGNGAFQRSASLRSVTFAFPSNVTTIDEDAFANTGLTDITIPESVTSIGNGAFQGSLSLTSVTFAYPSNLTSIDRATFSETGLTSITIPESIANIDEFAFARSRSLVSVYFEGKAPDAIGALAFSDLAESAKIYRFLGATGFECSVPLRACTAGEHWPSAIDPSIADTPFPARPPAPTATAGGQWDQISVTATSSLIGPTPTSITITANPGGATCDVSGPSGSCMFKSLNKDTRFTFTSIAHNADPTPSMASDASAPVTTGSPADEIITQLRNHPDPGTTALLLQMLKAVAPRDFEMVTGVYAGPQLIGSNIGIIIRASSDIDNPGSPSHQPEVAARAKKQVLCSVTKKIKRAGRVKLTCRYTKAALKLLRKHALHATLTVTFTPVSGAATTKTKALTIKRLH